MVPVQHCCICKLWKTKCEEGIDRCLVVQVLYHIPENPSCSSPPNVWSRDRMFLNFTCWHILVLVVRILVLHFCFLIVNDQVLRGGLRVSNGAGLVPYTWNPFLQHHTKCMVRLMWVPDICWCWHILGLGRHDTCHSLMFPNCEWPSLKSWCVGV